MFCSASVPACLASNAVIWATCSRVYSHFNPGTWPARPRRLGIQHHLPKPFEAGIALAAVGKRRRGEVGEQSQLVPLRQDHLARTGFLRQDLPVGGTVPWRREPTNVRGKPAVAAQRAVGDSLEPQPSWSISRVARNTMRMAKTLPRTFGPFDSNDGTNYSTVTL